MKKLYYLLSTATLFFFLPNEIYSQQSGFTKEQALSLVKENRTSLILSDEQISNAFISDCYINQTSGTKLVYLQQGYKGYPIYNVIKTIAFKNEKPVSNTGNFLNSLSHRIAKEGDKPTVQSALSVVNAASAIGLALSGTPVILSENNSKLNFGKLNVAKDDVTARLLWIQVEKMLLLCWQVKLAPINSSDYWLINVDAISGSIVGKINLTIYDDWGSNQFDQSESDYSNNENELGRNGNDITGAGYRVIAYPAETLNHPGGSPTLVTTPWANAGLNNPATSLGWHDDGLIDHDSTRGNNVWSRDDRAGNNGSTNSGRAAISTTPSPNLTFDFPFNPATSIITGDNQKFAITQLFYWNNIMHDLSYIYGFDEVSGNFQNSNKGLGGIGSDFVFADAQDGSGKNNANFSTPEDGSNPRMQMFLWESSSQIFKINSPTVLAGFKTASEANVSINNAIANKGPITENVVLYNPSTTGLNDACTLISNPLLVGKVALVDRGNCSFTAKIKMAQDAGAIAVIVVNNISSPPFSMTGSDNSIVIPAIMISQADGNNIKTSIQGGNVVNVTLKSLPLDGDLDNGIIGHEYAHGISNRLTGGPASAGCLTNAEQMGEGWSDYYALMTTTNWATAQLTDGVKRRPIGTYVYRQDPVTGSGIRAYPYTTDMNINQWTYGMVATNTGGGVHAIGSIWATVLWDMTWALIQVAGINPNFYNPNGVGGNSIAMKLVTEGMKLQPCGPGFIDGRNAILKADSILYNGQYSCVIWKAFARRGLGYSASQGSSDSYTDQIPATDLPTASINKIVDKAIVAQNEELTYTFTANCQCEAVSGYTIVDTLPSNLTYISGGTYNASNRTVTFNVPALIPGQSQVFTVLAKVNLGTYTPPVQHFSESVSTSSINPLSFSASANGSVVWLTNSFRSKSPSLSYFASDTSITSSLALTSTNSFNLSGISTLSFWHYFNTEETYDGGIVEISTNNGNTWTDLGPYMYQNPYNSYVGALSQKGFSGTSNGQFIHTLVNLAQFKGRQVRFRFTFASDQAVGGEGWYIDDIELKSEAGVYNAVKLFNASNVVVSSSDTLSFIANLVPVKWGKFTADKMGLTALLNWNTLQEQNSSVFIIERGGDGEKFDAIGTVKAAGNSNNNTQYSFVDASPIAGLNYYRLGQVDKDGTISYSTTRTVKFDGTKGNVSIYPNPIKDKIIVAFHGEKISKEMVITNTTGQIVGRHLLNKSINQINLSGLASGAYFFKIEGERVYKLVKE